MELTINDQKIKELLREILIEIFKENREEFNELLLEALEEIGLVNSINDGRQNDFVSEKEIMNTINT